MQRLSCLLLFTLICHTTHQYTAAESEVTLGATAATPTINGALVAVAPADDTVAAAGTTQSMDLLALEKERAASSAHEQSSPRQARQILSVYPYGYGGLYGGYRPFYGGYYPTYSYYYPRYYGFYPYYRYGYGYPSYFYG